MAESEDEMLARCLQVEEEAKARRLRLEDKESEALARQLQGQALGAAATPAPGPPPAAAGRAAQLEQDELLARRLAEEDSAPQEPPGPVSS